MFFLHSVQTLLALVAQTRRRIWRFCKKMEPPGEKSSIDYVWKVFRGDVRYVTANAAFFHTRAGEVRGMLQPLNRKPPATNAPVPMVKGHPHDCLRQFRFQVECLLASPLNNTTLNMVHTRRTASYRYCAEHRHQESSGPVDDNVPRALLTIRGVLLSARPVSHADVFIVTMAQRI